MDLSSIAVDTLVSSIRMDEHSQLARTSTCRNNTSNNSRIHVVIIEIQRRVYASFNCILLVLPAAFIVVDCDRSKSSRRNARTNRYSLDIE
jgi:hypothetical protein